MCWCIYGLDNFKNFCYNIDTIKKERKVVFLMMNARNFYAMVIDSTLPAEAKEFAQAQIEHLNARNAKRSEHDKAKRAAENAPLLEKLVTYLDHCTSWASTSEIAAALEISTSKVTALASELVAEGVVEISDVKVKGKRKAKGYRLNEKLRGITC